MSDLKSLITQHIVAERLEPTRFDGTTLDIAAEARTLLMQQHGLTKQEAEYLGSML